MTRDKNSFYGFLLLLLGTGYLWIFLNTYFQDIFLYHTDFCLFKTITSLPCPSCGSTRSVFSFLHGDLYAALYYNPLGILIAGALCITPFWIIYDLILTKFTLMKWYIRIEDAFKQKRIIMSFILVIASNWIWNIYKGI